MQRPKFVSAPNRLLRLPRLGQHSFRLVIDERVQCGIQAFDAIEVSARHLHGRNFFAADLRRDFPRGKKRRAGCHRVWRMAQRNQDTSERKKSRSPKAPAVQLVVCPDKLFVETWPAAATAYALRLGRTVKSRTCARMLDICIPLSCDRYGITSATN